jgi:hypothetical protein
MSIRNCLIQAAGLTVLSLVLVSGASALAGEITVFDGPGRLSAVQIMPGGTYLVAGEALVMPDNAEPGDEPHLEGLAALVEADGRVRWTRTYGGDGRDSFTAVAPASDEGAFLAGMSESYGQGGADAWVVRVGAKGEQLWQKYLGGAEDDFASGVAALDDGGCLVAISRSTERGPEIRLVRLDGQGLEVWSGPKDIMPQGVPGALHHLPPAAGMDGFLRSGGFVLAGTSFVRQGGTQPFALFFDPDFSPLDMPVPSAEGSAMVLAVTGPSLLSAWTEGTSVGPVRAGAVRITPDGTSRFDLVFDDRDTDAFGVGQAKPGPAVVGLNLATANGDTVRIQPLVDPNLPRAERYATMLDLPGRRGQALLVSDRTLALAGAIQNQREERPWLMLVSLDEFDGESLGY